MTAEQAEHPMAYHRQVMAWWDKLDQHGKAGMASHFRSQGVSSGLSKNANPDQRLEVIAWAEAAYNEDGRRHGS